MSDVVLTNNADGTVNLQVQSNSRALSASDIIADHGDVSSPIGHGVRSFSGVGSAMFEEILIEQTANELEAEYNDYVQNLHSQGIDPATDASAQDQLAHIEAWVLAMNNGTNPLVESLYERMGQIALRDLAAEIESLGISEGGKYLLTRYVLDYVKEHNVPLTPESLGDALDEIELADILSSECFVAGTKILLWGDSCKPIEEITPFDVVLAHSPDGTPVPGRVTKLFRNTTSEFVRLSFEDRDDLVATPGHRFLTETGDYMGIGHMLRLGGGTVRLVEADGGVVEAHGELLTYSADTAHLFPEATTKSIACQGNAVLKQDVEKGWATYNFEVEKYHNYVAGGIRVHNDSILSYMTPYELANLDADSLQYDSNGAPYFGVVKIPGTNTEIQKTLVTNADGTQSVVRETTTSDGAGNLIYIRAVEDENGNVVYDDPIYLTGQQAGQTIAASLTPFLTHAYLGDDANVLEQIAADTTIGTVLENLGEVIGGLAHRGLVDYGELDLGAQIDTALEVSFEDFGGELVVNGAETAISVINQLILAEVFEVTELDGTPGAIFDAVVNAGLTEILGNGLESFLTAEETLQFFESIGMSSASINTIENIEIGGFPTDNPGTPFNEGGVAGWTSLVFTAIINDVLPDLETMEGQVSSAITSAVLAAFNVLQSLGAFAGPAGAVIGWFVGQIFDDLFEEHPQAWTNVGFDEDTGRFVVLASWSNDGGDIGLSRSLAEAYVDGMNGFIDTVMSQSHNYDELAQWSFGHYESMMSNAGANGRNFAEFQEVYIDAFVRDIEQVQLNDGQLAAVRAIENLDLEQKRADFKEWTWAFLLNETLMNHSFPAQRLSEVMLTDNTYGVFYGGFLSFGYRVVFQEVGNGFYNPYQQATPPETIAAALQNADVTSFRDMLQLYVDHQASSGYPSFLGDNLIQPLLDIAGWETFEEFQEQFDVPDVLYDTMGEYELIHGNLQIAHDYHTYLENREAIDALVLSAPDTALAAGWVATIAQAQSLGLADPYEVTGDAIDNVFYTADGNDTVDGKGGNDLIKTYGGDDILKGAGGYDTLDGGRGDDILYGGAGDDILTGGTGADEMFGGSGSDRVDYAGAASAVVVDLADASLNEGEAAGDSYASIEGLHGSAYSDSLRGDGNGNEIRGGAGDDSIYGRGGDDALYGSEGNDVLSGADGNDYAEGGSGNDALYGSAGLDTLVGGGGADTLSGGDNADDLSGGQGNDQLWGQAGNDTLHGDGGNDYLSGDDGNDVLFGGVGADQLDGGDGKDRAQYSGATAAVLVDLANPAANQGEAAGDSYTSIENIFGSQYADELRGDSDRNVIWGWSGDDTIYGRAGDDHLEGSNGDDLLSGSTGNDYLDGGLGEDELFGGDGTDVLNGGDGADTLAGGDEADELSGGQGNDQLWGQAGHDTLIGGSGNDYLSGGSGADVFSFSGNFGNDTISDFDYQTAGEYIDFSGVSPIIGFNDLKANHMSQSGDDVLIDDGNGNTIILTGVNMHDLTGNDFVF